MRRIVPSSLRLEILDRLQVGHQGITKSRRRAQQSVWWPGLSTDIGELVKNCRKCCEMDNKTQLEPLKPTTLPLRPWQRVATDLMQLNQASYLIVVDYYSRFIELAKLKDTQSRTVVMHMKSIFSRHSIPEVAISDNGPQYSCQEFVMFSQDYGFTHITSSPLHPSGNGEAEREFRTVKNLIKPSADPYAAMLAYRTTPLENGCSPAEHPYV